MKTQGDKRKMMEKKSNNKRERECTKSQGGEVESESERESQTENSRERNIQKEGEAEQV